MNRRLGDRRGRPRFEIVGALPGTLDAVIGMPLLNVGKSGVLVQSPVALSPQSVHHITVSCEGQLTGARVQVRHVRPIPAAEGGDQFLIGLQFLSMPSVLEAQIDAWRKGDPQIARGNG